MPGSESTTSCPKQSRLDLSVCLFVKIIGGPVTYIIKLSAHFYIKLLALNRKFCYKDHQIWSTAVHNKQAKVKAQQKYHIRLVKAQS